MKLEEMKKRMPDAIRDVDYFNHIVIRQNDEIIRLLKKLAGEVEELPVIEVASLSIEVPIQEEVIEVPKKKRVTKKKEV